ncbi:hypothetical protein BHU72_13000 [Desulfuribacillus stibiiarsenatis]|uniref:YitT family protein n=1 Tax=Desulfuribacillus stibiiarsenatis TaxID=1390249 RepID=A0A1E5L9A4_9FIRM|nr:YitT family protein [Desulfuribacillus stibiiarsenatis]OEH86523.1 hypothetical protein BHU72_13000 [Desulfuribacillus stibiiarsenatis]
MKKILNILLGCFLASVGVILLKHSMIGTGGTAGLSLSASYLLNVPFSLVFFLVNIPFYVFSVLRMGWKFTISSIISVTLLSLMTSVTQWLPAFTLPIWFGAIAGGIIIGLGLSILFKNGSSLGGANILALFLQKRYNINPGKTNFIFDFMVVMSSMYALGITRGLFSILSIAIISKVIGYFKNEYANKDKTVQPKTSTDKFRVTPQIPVTR